MAEADAEQRHLALAAACTRSMQMPASLGVQGPGDKHDAFGFLSAIASSTVIWSLRMTMQRAPRSPRKWTRL